MAGDTRGKMVGGAAVLLATKGLQGTSVSELIEQTGAPRGSVYHHFPGGKDELVAAALELAGAQMLGLLESCDGASPAELTRAFVAIWRSILERSGFNAGCAVVAVTVAADSDELLERAGAVLRAWRERLAQLLREGGIESGDAADFAAALIAGCEGAVVLCRAERSLEPLDAVERQLLRLAG